MDLANTGGSVDATQFVITVVILAVVAVILALVELRYHLQNRKARKK